MWLFERAGAGGESLHDNGTGVHSVPGIIAGSEQPGCMARASGKPSSGGRHGKPKSPSIVNAIEGLIMRRLDRPSFLIRLDRKGLLLL